MVVTFIDKEVSLAVEAHFMGRAELSGFGRSAVAGKTFCSGPGDDREFGRSKIPAKDPAGSEIGKVHGAVGAPDDVKGIVDLRAVRGIAIRRRPSRARSDNRGHSRRRRFLRKRSARKERRGG